MKPCAILEPGRSENSPSRCIDVLEIAKWVSNSTVGQQATQATAMSLDFSLAKLEQA
jgi:hypothetical protein